MIRRENTVVKRCSFCGRDKKEALLLIAGIEGHICDVCISHAEEILQEEIPGYYHKTTDQSSEPDDRSSALEFPKAPSPNSCSFCGRVKSEALTLVAGINGYICDICIIQAEEIVREEFPDHSYLRTPDPSPKASNDGSAESGDNSSEPEGVPSESQADPSESNYTSIEFNIQASPPIACSFCGRDKNEALILIAGAKGHICEVCVDQAQGIVEDELYGVKKETKTELPEAFAQPLPKIKNAIVALSQELIIEERQVSELTQIFSNHYRNITENVSNYTAPNLFLVGPTGSGKSFVFEKIAGKFGFPITIVDSVSLVNSSFSEKENFLYNHFKNAGMKINLASVGIVVFKNIDKLISLHPDGQNLLNSVIGGGTISFSDSQKKKNYEIDTKRMVFAFTASFDTTAGSRLSPSDLVAFGVEKSIASSINFILKFDKISREKLFAFLSEKDNPILAYYTKVFKSQGLRFRYSPDGIQAIANEAYNLNLGLNGINYVMENIALYLSFLPVQNFGWKRFEINSELVRKSLYD